MQQRLCVSLHPPPRCLKLPSSWADERSASIGARIDDQLRLQRVKKIPTAKEAGKGAEVDLNSGALVCMPPRDCPSVRSSPGAQLLPASESFERSLDSAQKIAQEVP